jgi:ABC-2 type transport system permease protein
VGCLAFWFESATSLFDVWLGLFGIFSGYLVPLELYPRWVNDVSWYLPFRYMLAFPVELVTGGLSRSQALAQLGAQSAFVLVLLAVAGGMWRLGTRRFAAFGG